MTACPGWMLASCMTSSSDRTEHTWPPFNFWRCGAESKYTRGALPLYSPACVAGVYLIYFLIGNLSYTPCCEPSRTVLLLDVIYCTHTTDRHHRRQWNSPPWAAPFIIPPWCGGLIGSAHLGQMSRVRIRHLPQWSWYAAGSLWSNVEKFRVEMKT